VEGNANSNVSAISADGRYVAFTSRADNLVAGDTNGLQDAFIKDILTGVTTRVGTFTAGEESNFGSNARAISADGRFVAFSSNSFEGDYDHVYRRDLSKAGVQTLAGMVVNNKASAVVTMNLVQNYRNELIDYRGKLGASTSRLTSYMGTLNIGKLNLIAASSVITDADVASESATFVAASTRRQSASSLLAQANLVPEVALALLRNL
jgi:flagellin-like hook-associated protein FlgL